MSDSYTLWSPGERENVKQALFPEGLNYEPDLAIAVKARVDLSTQRIADLERENAKLKEGMEIMSFVLKGAPIALEDAKRQIDQLRADLVAVQAENAKLREERDAGNKALARVKDLITQSDDFSSDEAIKVIEERVGRYSQSIEWFAPKALREEVTQLRADLVAANERAERAEANFRNELEVTANLTYELGKAETQSDALRKALDWMEDNRRVIDTIERIPDGWFLRLSGGRSYFGCTFMEALTAAKSALGQPNENNA